MSDDKQPTPPGRVTKTLKEMKLENGMSDEEEFLDTIVFDEKKPSRHSRTNSVSPMEMDTKSFNHSPDDGNSSPASLKGEQEDTIGGEISVKMEPGQPLKLSRTSTQKVKSRAPPLFDHLADATAEATSLFQVMESCTYAAKYLGDTEHAMECDCPEEWGKPPHLPTFYRGIQA